MGQYSCACSQKGIPSNWIMILELYNVLRGSCQTSGGTTNVARGELDPNASAYTSLGTHVVGDEPATVDVIDVAQTSNTAAVVGRPVAADDAVSVDVVVGRSRAAIALGAIT